MTVLPLSPRVIACACAVAAHNIEVPRTRTERRVIRELGLRPNGSRLSCGALKKNSFPNLRAPPASSACQAASLGEPPGQPEHDVNHRRAPLMGRPSSKLTTRHPMAGNWNAHAEGGVNGEVVARATKDDRAAGAGAEVWT